VSSPSGATLEVQVSSPSGATLEVQVFSRSGIVRGSGRGRAVCVEVGMVPFSTLSLNQSNVYFKHTSFRVSLTGIYTF
jgi:paraquat-inducible protein B